MRVPHNWSPGGIRKLRLLAFPALVAIVSGCAWGEAIQATLHGDDTGSIIPLFRYVEDHAGKIRYEDISDDSLDVVLKGKEMPVASGAMMVNCGSVLELGIVVGRGDDTRNGFRHDYDFKLTEQDSALDESRPFIFEKYMRRSSLKGAVRFRGPLRNGDLTISVFHRRDLIYSENFTITGCELS